MYFEDLASFVIMGGHGPYVWSAYGIGLAVIAWNVIAAFRARRRVVSQVRRQIRIHQQQVGSQPAVTRVREQNELQTENKLPQGALEAEGGFK